MKKVFLSSFLILAFVIYAIQQQLSGNSNSSNLAALPAGDAKQSAAVTTPAAVVAYKDGQYTGNSVDAYYGNIQVKTTIQNGKIADVQFLNYPQDRNNSVRINTQAMPKLKAEAIQTQSANVDTVSGATYTSQAFKKSLASALSQAA